jgi:hypothetical protein
VLGLEYRRPLDSTSGFQIGHGSIHELFLSLRWLLPRRETLAMMTSNQLTPDRRTAARLFGQRLFAAGHGYGMGVAVVTDPKTADTKRGRGGVGTIGWPGALRQLVAGGSERSVGPAPFLAQHGWAAPDGARDRARRLDGDQPLSRARDVMMMLVHGRLRRPRHFGRESDLPRFQRQIHGGLSSGLGDLSVHER